MKPAAFGIRMHSGWGVLVTIDDAGEVLDRRRITIVSEDVQGGRMPFHHAEALGLSRAEKYLDGYTSECDRLAQQAIRAAVHDLKVRGYQVTFAGLVLASGRTLPDLAHVLASHALIHTAEGELFRESVRRGCESLGISVNGYRERELIEHAKSSLGNASARIIRQVANAGKALGPPWTADHKAAVLAAYLALHEHMENVRSAISSVT